MELISRWGLGPDMKGSTMNQTMRLLKLRCLNRGGLYTGEALPNGVRIGVRIVGKKTIWELASERMSAKAAAELMARWSL